MKTRSVIDASQWAEKPSFRSEGRADLEYLLHNADHVLVGPWKLARSSHPLNGLRIWGIEGSSLLSVGPNPDRNSIESSISGYLVQHRPGPYHKHGLLSQACSD